MVIAKKTALDHSSWFISTVRLDYIGNIRMVKSPSSSLDGVIMMNRITITFLTLLLVATLALGIAWRQFEGLIAGNYSESNGIWLVISGLFLMLALLGLGRILYRTAQPSSTEFILTEKEIRHV